MKWLAIISKLVIWNTTFTNIPDDVLMQLFEEVDNQQCTDVDPITCC